jgi:phosphate transport system protein
LSDLDEKVETGALKILALQAPVAKDLRRVGAMLKIITYLNRIGRYGYDIAKAVPDLPAKGIQGIGLVSIRQMGRNVERMLDLSLDAYRRHEAPDTKAIMAIEDEVDKQRFSVWREATAFMLQDPRNIEPCSHVMMVARYLERCGDNVVKIAEKQHYAATGERLRL